MGSDLRPFTEMGLAYDARVREHGPTVRACDWSSAERQELRFKILASGVQLHGRSVLDVGCGFGDLREWLQKTGTQPSSYVGVDLSQQMIAEARRRQPEGDFRVGNVLDQDLPRADVVVASGIFAHLGPRNERLVEPVVRRMFALCIVATSWNSLSSWADDVDQRELRLDPVATLRMCSTITPRLVLRHDYHPGDFSLHMFRE